MGMGPTLKLLTIIVAAVPVGLGCTGSEVGADPADTAQIADAGDTSAPDTGEPVDAADTSESEVHADTAAGDTTPPDPPEWEVLSLGDAGLVDDVYVVSPTLAYAVGGPRVLRYNGRVWAAYGEPGADRLRGVTEVDGLLVVVGDGGFVATRERGEPGWVASDSGTTEDLYAVAARGRDDVWAVGDRATVIRYGGDGWSVESSFEGVDLRALWIAPGTEGVVGVMAVGTGGRLVEYQAGEWRQQQIAVGTSVLRDVVGVGGTLFAVGSGATIAIKKPTSPTWQGQASNDPRDRDLFAIVVRAEDDAVVFGASGVVIRYNGDRWNIVNVAGPTAVTADLVAAGRAQEGAAELFIAVGRAGGGVRLNNSQWVDMPTQPDGGIRDLSGPSVDELWAVGRAGLVMRRGDFGWSAVPVGLDRDLNAVTVAPDGTAWVVGAEGTVLAIAPDLEVEQVPTQLPLDLFGVSASDDAVWVSGKGGTLLRIDPADRSMTVSPVPVGADLRAVARGGDGALWIAGAFGTLLRKDGDAAPAIVGSGVGGSLNALAPTTGGVMVAGDNGVVLDAGPDGVVLRSERPGLFLFGAAAGGGAAFAAGWSGTILRRVGDGFVEDLTGVGGVLETIWTDGEEAFAAGRQGLFLRRLEAPRWR